MYLRRAPPRRYHLVCHAVTAFTAINAAAIIATIPQKSIGDSMNAYYLLYAGALVFLMQAGFAMLCAGCLRAKNIKVRVQEIDQRIAWGNLLVSASSNSTTLSRLAMKLLSL